MAPTTITLVPHTHWDREWYAPFSGFSERLVTMMDVLLDLAGRGFPHFHLDGQTAMIDDYLERRPARADDVARHVREGRFSAGPWFTQMDEFLASGESHIRNLERGLARARELGRALEVGYMPDQFGHIGQMPQILRHAGLERAVVWRGVPRAVDRDVFRWEAPDGSSVLAEYLAFGYFNGAGLGAIDDPQALSEAIAEAVDRARPFSADDRVLVMVGYDHSGPDGAFPERLEAARPFLREIEVQIAGIDRHVADERTARVPVWIGELRSSARAHLLPNVVSARADQKRERGRVEALVERFAEPLAALVPGFEWPGNELDRVWTLLLWNGAHDSACGCSHDQVAIDVAARFAEARSLAHDVIGRALASLGTLVADSGILRWNPSPFEREDVPGLGWRVDPAHASESNPVPVQLSPGADGAIVLGELEIRLTDEPDVGDLYTFCFAGEDQIPHPPSRVTVDGHEVLARFDDRLQVRLTASRREGESFFRLAGVIDNGRPDHRLRLHVGFADDANGSLAGSVDESVDESVAGSPFELVHRPMIGEGSDIEAPSVTWPARGVVLAGGTAVFSEGVFEYEVMEGSIAVTLLRAVGVISRPALATRPSPAGPEVPTPLAQMMGQTTFALGVRASAKEGFLLEDLERFALPLLSARASGGGTLERTGSLLEIAGAAQLSNVRRKEGGIEVRLWNADKRASVETSVGRHRVTLGPARIETLRLDEPSAAARP